jgi:alpha-L-fucosidase
MNKGFCVWPTTTTDYSIKNSPYKNGKGDIVKEFVDACHKYGLKPGLYTAPWIDSNWESKQPRYTHGDSGDIHKFDNQELFDKVWEKEQTQITELMSNYGPLVFIWDDHFGRSDALYNEPKGGRLRELYAKFAHNLQPECLLLGRDVEHVGTEDGRASYPLWNSLNTIDGTLYTISDTYRWEHDNTGIPYGRFYRPQIACTTVAFTNGGWMWGGPRVAQPLERIMKTYYETIGRGATLIVNFAPDKRGCLEESTIAAAKAFGTEIRRRFDIPLVSLKLSDDNQIWTFNSPLTFNHIVSKENIEQGQKISAYRFEARINGKWIVITEGQTIGHKRIDSFDTVTATALKFTITDTIAESAHMKSIEIFNVSSQ